jgi:DNA replication protein DnaC
LTENKICAKCQGTGWVLENAGKGHVAKRCGCFVARQAEVLLEQANIPKRYINCSLANYEGHNDSLKDALAIAKKFVKNFPAQEIGVLFIGPCGVGKTHLAVAIIQELCAHHPLTAQEQGALEASRRILAALQRRECGTRADRLESPVRSYARRA